MYYSYVEIEYVATSFSPTRTDLAVKLLTKEMNSIKPEQVTPEVIVEHYETSSKKVKFYHKMNQIPANSNNATTGHKLQGMSKDVIIVSSWSTGGLSKVFKNWEYVVLSCVRTLSGLYLIGQVI